MRPRRSASSHKSIICAILVAWSRSVVAHEIMVVGIDRKFAFDDAGRRQANQTAALSHTVPLVTDRTS